MRRAMFELGYVGMTVAACLSRMATKSLASERNEECEPTNA